MGGVIVAELTMPRTRKRQSSKSKIIVFRKIKSSGVRQLGSKLNRKGYMML